MSLGQSASVSTLPLQTNMVLSGDTIACVQMHLSLRFLSILLKAYCLHFRGSESTLPLVCRH